MPAGPPSEPARAGSCTGAGDAAGADLRPEQIRRARFVSLYPPLVRRERQHCLTEGQERPSFLRTRLKFREAEFGGPDDKSGWSRTVGTRRRSVRREVLDGGLGRRPRTALEVDTLAAGGRTRSHPHVSVAWGA